MSTTITSITQAQSLASVRNFLRCAITHIAYVRDLCPDSSFAFKDILGVKMRLLVPNHEQSVALVDSIENGVFDALRRGYLRELDLCIYNEDLTDVLESYVFVFQFSQDGKKVQMKVQTGGEGESGGGGASWSEGTASDVLKWNPNHRPKSPSGRCSGEEARTILLRMLSQLTSFIDQLPPLNQKSQIGLRLLYHDSKTPKDYVPPGYADATPLMRLLYYRELRFNVPTSVSAATSHHYVGFSLRSATLAQLRSQLLSSKWEGKKGEDENATAPEDASTAVLLTQEESDEQLTLPSSSHTSSSAAPPGWSSSPPTLRLARSGGGTPSQAPPAAVRHAGKRSREREGEGAAFTSGGGERMANADDRTRVDTEAGRRSPSVTAVVSEELSVTTVRLHPSPPSPSFAGPWHDTEGKAVQTAHEERQKCLAVMDTADHHHTGKGSVDPVMKADVLATIPTVSYLAACSRLYTRREVAFLLLVLTVFSFSPNVPGGRGILTGTEVSRFVTQTCVVEVSEDWCLASIRQLVSEGYLQALFLSSPSSRKENERLSSTHRWRVMSAPVLILRQLMQHQELKELLFPSTLDALQGFLVLSNVACSIQTNVLSKPSKAKLGSKTQGTRVRQQKKRRTETNVGRSFALF